jgi:hypothetical protein
VGPDAAAWLRDAAQRLRAHCGVDDQVDQADAIVVNGVSAPSAVQSVGSVSQQGSPLENCCLCLGHAQGPSCGSVWHQSLLCVRCGMLGTLGNVDFHNHLIQESHHLCVHVEEPFELYCGHCGDFQYSDYFDDLMHRKRRFSISVSSVPDVTQLISSAALQAPTNIRGICNMGSTCFMSSVIQVLLNNETVKKVCSRLSEWCLLSGGNFGTVPDFSPNQNKEGSRQPDTNIMNGGCGHNAPRSVSYGCIACELLHLLKQFRSKDNPGQPIVPSNLLYSLWCHADYLAGSN